MSEEERGLSGKELTLIKKVHDELGEIPSASLEIVLRRGSGAHRFQCLAPLQMARISELAEETGVKLPTEEC